MAANPVGCSPLRQSVHPITWSCQSTPFRSDELREQVLGMINPNLRATLEHYALL